MKQKNPVLKELELQINKRILFGNTLALLTELGNEIGVHIAVGTKHTKKAVKHTKAKKTVKKIAKKRKVSAAARKNIAKAQKARWVKFHAEQKAKKKAAK